MFTIFRHMWYRDRKEDYMNLRRTILTALFAALLVAGAYIAIPVGPVPVTLQTAFVLLVGMLCGSKLAATSVAVYLALGAIGLPVFSGGVGGFAHFAGPTGGFLISWLIAAPLAGFCADIGFREAKGNADAQVTRRQLLWMIVGAVSGTLVLHAIGLPIMKFVLNISWTQAFAVGLIPFLPGDLVKLVAVILLGNMFANRVRTYLAEEQLEEATTDE